MPEFRKVEVLEQEPRPRVRPKKVDQLETRVRVPSRLLGEIATLAPAHFRSVNGEILRAMADVTLADEERLAQLQRRERPTDSEQTNILLYCPYWLADAFRPLATRLTGSFTGGVVLAMEAWIERSRLEPHLF